MTIVHVTECLAGGVLTFLRSLTGVLSEDHHVLIYSDRPDTPTDVRACFGANVELVYWPHAGREIRPLADARALAALVRLLAPYRTADAVQLHSSKAGFLGRVACRLLGMHHVYYLPHGLSFAREDVSRFKKGCYILLERIANAVAGEVIACSPSERALLMACGIRPVHVICNAVEPLPAPAPPRTFTLPLVIGTSGHITLQKGPADFHAIAASFADDPRVRFVWIGDGGERPLLREAECSNLHVTGWLSPEDVRKTLQGIDVYLSTSRWEGLPYAVLEAMNLGRPLLLSRCVGNVDLVDGENGRLFADITEAHDAIEVLLVQPERLAAQGAHSHARIVQEFSLARMGERYRALYAHGTTEDT